MSEKHYDVVIVGGGTAGCVSVSRLSATKPGLHFLLLEAGPNNNDDDNVRTPTSSRRMFGNDKYDWCLNSTPQSGLNGRVIAQTRGRMIGGSSAINSHSLVYPNREMHDAWAELVGDPRWKWEGMQRYYEKFQSMNGGTGSVKGDGPIRVSYPNPLNRLQRAWEQAFEDLGAVASSSPTNGDAMGGGTTANAIDSRPGKGERSHAGIAYLAPALERTNITVETGCLVEKVLFEKDEVNDDKSLRAVGLKYRVGSLEVFARASKEIILCAGVFGSPKILELSGIGRSEVLSAAGVEQLLDLPGVGGNLQDHLNYGPSVEIDASIETFDSVGNDQALLQERRRQYAEHKTGWMAAGGAYSFAYWPLQLFNSVDEETQLKAVIDAHRQKDLNSKALQSQASYIYDSLLLPRAASATVFMVPKARYTATVEPGDYSYMSVIAMLSHPLSRGSSHIRSKDPAEPPTIDPCYLKDDLDLEVLARHVLQIEDLLRLPAWQGIVVPSGRRYPRAFDKPPKSLDDAKAAIRQYSATNYHPCGTAAMMGPDVGGVVDGKLRVYGTSNLRICDASIFPIVPRGNILTTVYAVAEKAVDVILEDWR